MTIIDAKLRVSQFHPVVMETLESSRPKRIWEKAHTFPISAQDRFNSVTEDPIDWEQVSTIEVPLRLYVHIPWCKERCTFCRYSIDTRDSLEELVNPYFEALENELDHYAEKMGRPTIPTEVLYVGGGTPSSLSPSQTKRLFDIIAKRISFVEGAFKIAECSPGTITKEKAQTWRNCGVTRISMGVQSFDDDVLRLLRRDHDSEDVLRAYHILREVGFPEINIDIMLALPGQSYDSFEITMEKVIELRPSSISLLDLHLAPRSKLYAEGFQYSFQDNLVMRAIYQAMLPKAGYQRTRVHYYVLPNEMQHPSTRCPCLDSRVDPGFQLGIGVSAHSELGNTVTINTINVHNYQQLVNGRKLPITKTYQLSEEDKISMKAMRGVMDDLIIPSNGELLKRYEKEMRFLISHKLITEDLRLTDDGCLFGSEICFLFYPEEKP